MRPIRPLLAAGLLIGTLTACDSMNSSMNDVHETLHVEDSTKDAPFTGLNGDAQTHCSPAQRSKKVCY